MNNDKMIEEKLKNNDFLTKKSKIKFNCTACGDCCYNQDIILTPIDILRLRRELQTTTDELLRKNIISIHIGPNSKLPVCVLKFPGVQTPTGNLSMCPFLKPEFNDEILEIQKLDISLEEKKEKVAELVKKKILEGKAKRICSIYKNRPTVCRLYPLGRVTEKNKKTGKMKLKFMMIDKDKIPCKKECFKKEVTVEQWLKQNDETSFEKETLKFYDIFTEIGEVVIKLDHSPSEINSLANVLYNFDTIIGCQLSLKNLPNKTKEDKVKTFELSAGMAKNLGDVFNLLPNFSLDIFSKAYKKEFTDEDLREAFNQIIDISNLISCEIKQKYGSKTNPNKSNKKKS